MTDYLTPRDRLAQLKDDMPWWKQALWILAIIGTQSFAFDRDEKKNREFAADEAERLEMRRQAAVEERRAGWECRPMQRVDGIQMCNTHMKGMK